MTATVATPQLQGLLNPTAAVRSGWGTQIGWVVVLAVLAWAWQGAEMHSLDFHDWRVHPIWGMPLWLSYAQYRFESTVRAAPSVGRVVTVTPIDVFSAWLRKRLI